MYKLIKDSVTSTINRTERLNDTSFIPFDPANTDYQTFKSDISNGVELQDPDGNKMTKAKVTAFLKTLP